MDNSLLSSVGGAGVLEAKCSGKAYGVFTTQKEQYIRAKDFIRFQLAMGESRNLLYSPGHDSVTFLLDGIYYIGYTVYTRRECCAALFVNEEIFLESASYTGIIPEHWCGILTLKKGDMLKIQLGLNAKLFAAELKIFSLCGR